jgi:hypothetical protein
MNKFIITFFASLCTLVAFADNFTYIKGPTLHESSTTQATAGGTTTLTYFSNMNQQFTGTQNQTVVLPDATTLNNDQEYFFSNRSTGIITVKDNSSTTLVTIPAGYPAVRLHLIYNTTSAGTWDIPTVQSLNGLTPVSQSFATGTTGTDFGISSSGSTHTFNLPDASATARGAVNTGTQTFAGTKTFNSTISGSVSGNAGTASASDHSITSCSAHNWAYGESTAWALSCSQPNFSDLAGSATYAQLPLPQPSPSGYALLGNGTTFVMGAVQSPLPAPSPSGKFLGTDGSNYVLVTNPNPSPLPAPSPSGYALTGNGTAFVMSPPPSPLPAPSPSGDVLTANGTAWIAAAPAAASPLTTKGDLYGYSTTNSRIPVGADATVLTADSTQTLGVKWATPPVSTTLTTKGDIQTYSTTNARLPVGADGNGVVADSSQTTGLRWVNGPTGPKNFVANPSGFSTANNWTLTNGSGSGSFTRDTTSGNGIGGTVNSLKFIAAGSGDYVTSDAMTLDNDVTGNCQASFVYKSTSSVYSLNLMNGSTVLQTLILPVSATYVQPQPFNYPCASGYSIRITASGTASSAAINFGNVYWGQANPASATLPPYAIPSTLIDWSRGNVFTQTLSVNTTYTFSNQTPGQVIIVRLTNTSNYTVTWPTLKWSASTAPVMTTGAHTDVYTFVYDGTNTYGNYTQNF